MLPSHGHWYCSFKTIRAAEIHKAKESGFIHGVKLYPAGATTNSEFGVTSMDKVDNALKAMVEARMPLLVHGEVTDAAVDLFDREKVFIETILQPLVAKYPDLRIVMEHITTEGYPDSPHQFHSFLYL